METEETNMANYPVIQTTVDAAYARWNSSPSWDPQAFWDQLDAMERVAVFAGNLNYQVENGGFAQWYDNGYATPETIGFLERLCTRIGTPAALEVRDLIGQSRSPGAAVQGDADRDWDWNDELEGEFSQLDTRYYAVSDSFLADVQRFILVENCIRSGFPRDMAERWADNHRP